MYPFFSDWLDSVSVNRRGFLVSCFWSLPNSGYSLSVDFSILSFLTLPFAVFVKHKIIACKSHGIIYVVELPSTCLRPCPTVFSSHVHVCLSCPQQLPRVTRLWFPQQQQLLAPLTAILISSNHKAEAFTDERLSLQCSLITSIMIQTTLYMVNFLSYVTIWVSRLFFENNVCCSRPFSSLLHLQREQPGCSDRHILCRGHHPPHGAALRPNWQVCPQANNLKFIPLFY